MRITSILVLCVVFSSMAGQYDASATFQQNYKQWGWDTSYVLANNLVTMAVVPKIGARIMQYDLGTHPFLWVNHESLGQTYWGFGGYYANFGGYKMWPAPQGNWQAKWGGVWPPPMRLDQGPYTGMVATNNAESSSVYVESMIEDTGTACKGLRFKRTMTVYKSSSRIRVMQTMDHTDTGAAQWSIWDVTQVQGNHSGEEDWNNFWAYFPKKSGTPVDSTGYFVMRDDTVAHSTDQCKPNIAPGISGVNYGHTEVKIGSPSDGGWIAWADEREGFVYVKKFQYFTGLEYPDQGSVIQIYTYKDTGCVEIEVMSPIQSLPPTTGTYSFAVDWYAACMHGPVLAVSNAGAVNQHFAVSNTSVMTGKFGVFYAGRVDLIFNNSATAVKSYTVTPLDSFRINESVSVPGGVTKAFLCLYNANGALVDTLDKADVTGSGVVQPLVQGAGWTMNASGNVLHLQSDITSKYQIEILRLNGTTAGRFAGLVDKEQTVRLDMLAPGTYLARVSVAGHIAMVKLSIISR